MNINPVHEIPQGALYLPDGNTTITPQERNASKAVEEYDASLILGYRQDVNEWVVFVREGPDGPFPVLGLGQTLPHPDDIKKRLYSTDAVRHGQKIFEAINRENERLRLEARAYADEEIAEASERLAHEFAKHKGGNTSRIFVPKGV